MKHIKSFKFIVIITAILLVVASWLWVHYAINRNEIVPTKNIANKDFNNNHFNYIITDTFINLLHKAYGNNITTSEEGNKLKVILQNAGAITKDFFNGNDNIPKLGLSDYGFEINYYKNSNKIEATFDIKNNAVPVPNDVMIKLINITYHPTNNADTSKKH